MSSQAGSAALFGGGDLSNADIPTVKIEEADYRDGKIDILGILVKAGLCPTRNEARRAVEQGGVTVDDEKVTDIKTLYSADDLKDGKLVRRGKKAYKKVTS